MSTDSQAGTPDLFALAPAGAAALVVRERRLPPLYYLHNLRLALASLTERYAELLSADEVDFIEQFDRQSEPVQCLLGRLVMRTGSLFRRASLRYAEVPDLEQALQALAALGWLDLNPLLCADELARVLNSQELRVAVGIRRGLRPHVARSAAQKTQLALPLGDQPIIHRSLSDWNARLAGSVIRWSAEPLMNRLQALFFGNPHQSWAEFVLVDLGVARYESVPLDANARAFHSREEIEHFYRLNECRARLDAGDPPIVVREAGFVPDAVEGWLRSRFLQLHLRIAERFEDEGDTELAVRSYRESTTVEGLVNAVRLQMRSGLYEEARREALAAREAPCSEAQHEAIDRALVRIERHRGTAPARRRTRDNTEVLDLVLPKLAGRQRVELAVAERLDQPDSPVFYVENSLLSSLFGLLCWEAIFAPLPGAFFHPFQVAPADLYSVDFRPRRAPHFSTLLELLDTGHHEAAIWQVYRAKAGIRTHFVRWARLRPPLLKLALQCIPARHLRLCFERLLDDLKENASGMPDLIQFWPQERRYRLIEVKGPGDRLQDNQRRWLRFFDRHDMPAAVCKVQWQSTYNPPATRNDPVSEAQ
jgi:hypothetical protein